MKENVKPENNDKREWPREKLARLSIDALTDKELLMLLIGSGTNGRNVDAIASELLKKLDKEEHLEPNEIMLIPGIGFAKASIIAAALELGRRRKGNISSTISTARDIFNEVRHFASREQENLIVVMLNGAYEVLGTRVVTRGLIDQTLSHPRDIFAPAVEKRAIAICLAHNHPTGRIEPSAADKAMTRRIKESSLILGIKLLDHIIFTDSEYYSFLEHSLI